MAWTDSEILSAIQNYYGTNSSIWNRISTNSASWQDISRAFDAIPRIQTVNSINGSTLGIDYQTRFAEPPSVFEFVVGSGDSNYAGSSYGGNNGYMSGNIPVNAGGGGGSDYTLNAGATSTAGGVAQTAMVVADKLSLAVTGVNLGAKLGAMIDSAIYDLDPAWWDVHYPTINPQTWTSIAGESELGKGFIRTLFGLKNDSLTAYVDSDLIAYTYQLLRDNGAFKIDYTVPNYVPKSSAWNLQNPQLYTMPYSYTMSKSFDGRMQGESYSISGTGTTLTCYLRKTGLSNVREYPTTVSDAPFTVTRTYNGSTSTYTSTGIAIAGSTYYYCDPLANNNTGGTVRPIPVNTIINTPMTTSIYTDLIKIGFGSTTGTQTGGVPGIQPMPDATIPDESLITGTTPQEIDQQLRQNYPDLYTDSITSSTPQPDGSIRTREYVPIPWANDGTQQETAPTTKTISQTDTEIKPETVPQLFPTTETDTSDPPTDTPPDVGTGNTPTTVLPIVSPSALWAIYNPSDGELNSFGAWLWSPNFIDNILKLFANPMQAVISLHKIYCSPTIGSAQHIVVGYLDSGVSANVVTQQYVSFSCGKINISEYYGNVFDYAPYTSVHIYLPFIGVQQLNVADVMRGNIEVVYSVDVYTGACTAKVNVKRDGMGGTLYEYAGNAAVFYPISSGDYTGVIRGIISAATGIAAAVATANPLAAAGGVIGGAMQSSLNVQRSGSFAGNAGAMNLRKPFVIISRPQTHIANYFNRFNGKPANDYVKVNECTGFIRGKYVIPDMTGGITDSELKEIENLIETGILV